MLPSPPPLVDLAFYPLALTQGLYVKYRAAQLCEAAGPRHGAKGRGPDLRVLIVGDSSAAGVGVDTQDQALAGQLIDQLSVDFRVRWQLAARCGATAASAMTLLDAVDPQPFDVAVTALGVNDAKNGVTISNWRAGKAALYERLQDEFGVRLICASGMPPVQDLPLLPSPLKWALSERARNFDLANRALIASMPAVRYLQGPARLLPEDMASDGFHPGPAVYREWGRLAANLIRDNWPVSSLRRQALVSAAE